MDQIIQQKDMILSCLKINPNTFKHILFGLMILVYTLPIYYLYSKYNESSDNLSSLFYTERHDKKYESMVKSIIYITLLYETMRNDNLSYYSIYIMMLAFICLSVCPNNNMFHIYILLVIFICINCFMFNHCMKEESELLCLLQFIGLACTFIIMIERYSEKKVLYQEALYFIVFILFYVLLHFIS
jgi:hypothetical protein